MVAGADRLGGGSAEISGAGRDVRVALMILAFRAKFGMTEDERGRIYRIICSLRNVLSIRSPNGTSVLTRRYVVLLLAQK